MTGVKAIIIRHKTTGSSAVNQRREKLTNLSEFRLS